MTRSGQPGLSFLRGILAPLVFLVLILFPIAAAGQGSMNTAAGDFNQASQTLQNVDRAERVWKIFGHVTTLAGDPVSAARLVVDPGAARPQIADTNLKGEFSTDVTLTVSGHDTIHIRITVSKEGYFTAHELVEFKASEKGTREIPIVLRDKSANSDLLTPEALRASLEARFRAPANRENVPSAALKDYDKALEKLFSENLPVDAAVALNKSVAKAPDCINCRLLLCLADLTGDAIAAGDLQEAEIDKRTASGRFAPERNTLFYLAGVVETWRKQYPNAVGFFQKALALQPSDPLSLQELGRTLLLQKNWEAADDYLGKALRAGASSDAHLLRARALLEMSDVDSAAAEMQAYIGDRPVRELPTSARLTYLDLHQRLEMKSLSKVNSVVDQPIPQLRKAMPELEALEASPNQDALPVILQKVGDRVEGFFRDFSSTISVEDIRVENLGATGQVKGVRDEKHNYLLLAKPESWGLGLTEYRATPDGKMAEPLESRPGAMRTKGFASASVVFHPAAQKEARFRLLGHQHIDGRDNFVVAFAQEPEKAKMVGLIIVDGVSEPALVQGVAWVDAELYAIVRMRTDLLRALTKVRLSRQTTEIHYSQVHFKDAPAGVWLPEQVTVTVQWKGHTFRNCHTYSSFKRFNVAAEEKRKGG